MPSSFRPTPLPEMKKKAQQNAKGGDVVEVGRGLMYVRSDTRPVSTNKKIVTENGWYIDTIVFDNDATTNPEHAFIIMPITEVPE